MKIKSFFLIFTLFLSTITFSAARPYLETLEGQKLYGSDLKGRWLLLHYWASWCDICMGEMPEVQKFYKGMPREKAQLFLVNYDGLSKEQQKKLLAKMGIRIPSLQGNPGRLFGIRAANALPMTIVVNPEGKVQDVAYGPVNIKTLSSMIQH